MEKVSIDIFAETNPAFCSIVLLKYCEGYFKEAKEGIPFPLLLLPLPIILSDDLAKTFEGTNSRTGFFHWVENNPELLLNLSERIDESSEFIKPAIEFGFYKRIFILDEKGFIHPQSESIKKITKSNLDIFYKHAERMGQWVGQIKSVKTIYNCLGIQI